MWLMFCPRCQQTRMYSASRVRAVHNLPDGVIVVRLDCYCGEPITVLTGRGLTEEVRLPATAPGSRPPAARP